MTASTWRTGGGDGGGGAAAVAARLAQGLFLALILAACLVAIDRHSTAIAGAAFAGTLVLTGVYVIRSWRSLLLLLFCIIWFIPIKRYNIPINLGFDLEPYRIFVALLVMIWVTGLLLDKRIRLRSSGLELPFILLYLSSLVSICVNSHALASLGFQVDTLKGLSFSTSFFLVYFVIVSVTRTRSDLDFLIKVLVVCGAIVGFTAVIEYRTGYNVFNHLDSVLPIFTFTGPLTDISRDDRLRVYASSQHPIALAAAFVVMLPLAIYLARSTGRARWWVLTSFLGIGMFTTLSRTGVTMVVAGFVTFWICRPREAKRLLPLIVPGVIVVFLLLPNSLGSLESAFFPQGGLIQDQTNIGQVGVGYQNGRLATLGPGLDEWLKHPIFGDGGTRQLDPTNPNPDATNTSIYDDQWLDELIGLGAVGTAALLWMIARSSRRLARLARRDVGPDGLLAGSLAASIVAFAVGSLTFDAFSFIQAAFLFYIVLALGGTLLALKRDEARGLVPARGPS